MSTKKQGVPCFDNAAPDEPIFVLRAQDRLAAATVRFWAQLMEASRGRAALVKEARDCATAMDNWPVHKLPD
jgi:hypothetical protein